MDTLLQDVRYAVRRLLKSPGFTAISVLTLALGIGANAAIFSLFHQVLLRPLPVAHPDELVNLGAPGPKPGSISCGQAGGCDAVFSYPMFRDLQASAKTGLAGIAAHSEFGANLAYGNQTINGEGTLVSGSYFPLLGLKPALGRLLDAADDQTIGGDFVAVLSYNYWRNHLGADPGVLNRTITINGQPMTIVGVAPRDFAGTTLGSRPQVFVPITMRGLISTGSDDFDNRRGYWAYLFARLKPGVSIEQAHIAVNSVYRAIINNVEAPLQEGMSEQVMARFRTKELTLADGSRGQSSIPTDARTPLTLLFVTTAIVLLIACANIANLLLARGANRGMEMVIRLSLGASRRRVVAQLLTESCVLAIAGGLAGLWVAWATLAGIASILPPKSATMLHLDLHPSVVGFAATLSITTGLFFGVFPAFRSTRPDLVTMIRANAGQIAGAISASRFRSLLVTLEIALSVALLVSAGLCLKSLRNVSRVDLGLRADHVVTFGISPGRSGYEPGRSEVLFRRLKQELAAIPGVTSVSASQVPIFSGRSWASDVTVEGFEPAPGAAAYAYYNKIGPGYFRTLGIPLLAGREFTSTDNAGASDVAIVNQAFAKEFGLGPDAIGKHMAAWGDEELTIQIVGLVRDAKYSDVKDEVPPLFFTPYRQDEGIGAITYYARTAADPQRLLRAVPFVVAKLDPSLPVEDLKTLPQQIQEDTVGDRMISILSAAFAVLATLLAVLGLYGVLAYSVAGRTRELGVRMALGAREHNLRRMVLRQGFALALPGVALGLVAAFAATRLVASLLYGVSATDPLVFASVAVLLAGVALLASYIPARRATRVDPMVALRSE